MFSESTVCGEERKRSGRLLSASLGHLSFHTEVSTIQGRPWHSPSGGGGEPRGARTLGRGVDPVGRRTHVEMRPLLSFFLLALIQI